MESRIKMKKIMVVDSKISVILSNSVLKDGLFHLLQLLNDLVLLLLLLGRKRLLLPLTQLYRLYFLKTLSSHQLISQPDTLSLNIPSMLLRGNQHIGLGNMRQFSLTINYNKIGDSQGRHYDENVVVLLEKVRVLDDEEYFKTNEEKQ